MTWPEGRAASGSRPGPPATACPGRAVSTWGHDNRDSRGDVAAAVSFPCVQVAAVVRVVAGGPAGGPRDFVPRSSAPGCGSSAGDCAAASATLRDPVSPRKEQRRRRRRRQCRGPDAAGRPAARDPVRRPPPRPLRSCTAAGSVLSVCVCNR